MTSSRGNYQDATVAVVLLLVIQALLATQVGVFNGILVDSDVYMWLNRASQLVGNGNWFDHSLPRIDPPVGYEQHWTRPFDMVLISGAWLGSFITEFSQSLYIWSVVVSPLLGVLALFSFLWQINPFLGNKEYGVAGLLFVTQMSIISTFAAGRADHQSLILLLFILSLGTGLRMLLRPFSQQSSYLPALVAALAIWVSVESILFPLLTIFAFGLYWLLGENGITRKLVHYSIALFLLLILFRMVEFGPSQLFEPALDQISIIYIALFGLLALYWILVYGFECRTGKNTRFPVKLSVAIAWAVCTAILLEYCFPGFLSGPMSNIDDLFKRVHLAKIKELQPVISLTAFSTGDWLEPILRFSLWLGIIVPGIPVLIYLILKSKGTVRQSWAFIGIFSLAYIPLSLNEIRWTPYTAILMLPGYIWGVMSLIQHIAGRYKGQGAGLMRVLVLVASVIIFALPKVLFSEDKETNKVGSCPLIPISEYLSNPATWGDRTRNVLAFTDFGPELLYRTPHAIFSIPSHRYHPGFTDSYMIMTATDDTQARHLTMDRRIDLILICPKGEEQHFYAMKDDAQSLHKRLSSDKPPAWLEQIVLPDNLSSAFKLYLVDRSEGTQRKIDLDDSLLLMSGNHEL